MQSINDEQDTIMTENGPINPRMLGVNQKFRSQTLPGDVLALIVKELSFHPKELFAPLICSRVCLHWRNEIFGTPLLWSSIDTSRGLGLTELWLANAGQSLLDIRLCDPPLRKRHLEDMQSRSPPPSSLEQLADLIPESLVGRMHRWRSLDVSFSCTCRVSKVLEHLSQYSETLCLDSLTIGPMGKTILVLDDIRNIISTPNTFPSLSPLADPHSVPIHFRNINIKPAQLHVDTYLLWYNAHTFSPCLTVLEVFLGSYLTHDPDHIEWYTILSSTPNLVELSLWDPQYGARRDAELPKIQKPVELRSLRTLKLSGRFIYITELLAASPLPSLRNFSLDSIDTTFAIIPLHLSRIAVVSPELSHVSIGSMYYTRKNANAKAWAKAFRTLRTSLQELTFVGMEWLEVALALNQLSKHPHMLSRLRLKEVWDMEPYDWSRLQSPGREMPTIEHEGGGYGGTRWCKSHMGSGSGSVSSWGSSCRSEATSNYSENSSFTYTEGNPSSEELDSDESEVSFDSDTDSLLIEVEDAEEERGLALAIRLTPELESATV